MCSGTFCTKFNREQLLSEASFDAMRIFGNVVPQTVSTFPFLYIIIFQRGESFDPPSSTFEGDRHMRSRTFSYKIQFRTTFI